MNKSAVIQRLIDSGHPLEKIVEEAGFCFYPDYFQDEIQYNDARNIIGATRIYDLVQRFLKEDIPVFCGEENSNDNLIQSLPGFYVPGYGTTDISQLTMKPLVTGKILSIQSWDEFVNEQENSGVNLIYESLMLIAEIVARQKDAYDITCMQIPQYEILISEINQRIGDTSRYGWQGGLENILTEQDARNEPPLCNIGPYPYYSTTQLKLFNMHNRRPARDDYGDSDYDESPDCQFTLEDGFIYVPKYNYYMFLRSMHCKRTRNGEYVGENEVR